MIFSIGTPGNFDAARVFTAFSISRYSFPFWTSSLNRRAHEKTGVPCSARGFGVKSWGKLRMA
jgi:hypothetical protein